MGSDIKVNPHEGELGAAEMTAQSTLSVGVGLRSLEHRNIEMLCH